MTVDAYDRRLNTFADLKYKEKERKGRFGEEENITREEYSLH